MSVYLCVCVQMRLCVYFGFLQKSKWISNRATMVVNGLRHPEPTIIIFAMHHNNILSIVELRHATLTVRLRLRLCAINWFFWKITVSKNRRSWMKCSMLLCERSFFSLIETRNENANWLAENSNRYFLICIHINSHILTIISGTK